MEFIEFDGRKVALSKNRSGRQVPEREIPLVNTDTVTGEYFQ